MACASGAVSGFSLVAPGVHTGDVKGKPNDDPGALEAIANEVETGRGPAPRLAPSPPRVGPRLDHPAPAATPPREEYAGQPSARRGQDWRVRYRIEEQTHTVIVFDVSHRSVTYGT